MFLKKFTNLTRKINKIKLKAKIIKNDTNIGKYLTFPDWQYRRERFISLVPSM